MPPVDSPPLAVIELMTAQEIPVHIATAVDGLLPILSQQPRNIESAAGRFPVRDLAEIAEYGARVIQGFAAETSKPKEAEDKGKVWGIVACIVVVVVAVIIAVISTVVTVFTFGTGTLMGVAIAGVFLPLNSAGSLLVDFLNVAARGGHPLAAEMAAIMSQVMTTLRMFLNSSLADSMTARDKAFREILQSLRRIERLIPAVHKIEGPCLGDPQAVFKSCQALIPLLTRLTESLWFARFIPSSEVKAVVHALEPVRQALAEAQPRLHKRVHLEETQTTL